MTVKRAGLQNSGLQTGSRISESRLKELLDSAAEVFSEKGFDGASVGEMARRANASKGTYYSRFSTKEELLLAVMGRTVEDLEERLSQFMKPGLSVEQALTQFADQVLSVVLSESMLANYRVVMLEARRFPELGRTYYKHGADRVAEFLGDYLKRKAGEGELKLANPRLAAEQFIDSVVGMPRLRAALGIGTMSKREKADRIEHAVTTFVRANTA